MPLHRRAVRIATTASERASEQTRPLRHATRNTLASAGWPPVSRAAVAPLALPVGELAARLSLPTPTPPAQWQSCTYVRRHPLVIEIGPSADLPDSSRVHPGARMACQNACHRSGACRRPAITRTVDAPQDGLSRGECPREGCKWPCPSQGHARTYGPHISTQPKRRIISHVKSGQYIKTRNARQNPWSKNDSGVLPSLPRSPIRTSA